MFILVDLIEDVRGEDGIDREKGRRGTP